MERLYQSLESYSKEDIYPFHMPGHKRNPALLPPAFPVGMDITEIDGFDNLHHPEGILKEAQEFLSRMYGTRESYYSVNGSTAALLTAISASVKKGGKILMARNCHKSAYHGVYLRDLNPVYLYPPMDSTPGISGGIVPSDVEKALQEHPDVGAVLITSPTYEGVVSDVGKIAEIAHRFQIPLIVDEAHGAHFHFSSYFPISAADLGADLVIQSLHKTLPSLTQTGVLHRCSDRVDPDLIRRFLGIYQSSSPSYILMAGMDACMDLLHDRGEELFEAFAENLEEARSRLSRCENIRLYAPQPNPDLGIFDCDRSKLVLCVENTSLTGKQLYEILLSRYHLQMEMAAPSYVLALTSVGDTKKGFLRLCQAVEELDKEKNPGKLDKETILLDERPVARMSISQALDAPRRSVPLQESAGEISADYVFLYPPGIPLLAPGEEITEEMVENLRKCRDQGLEVQGLTGQLLISVLS